MIVLKQRARELRVNDTKAENRLWQALRNRQLDGWKFRRQHPIDRYFVDFIAVAWQAHRRGRWWHPFDNTEIAYDEQRTRRLEALGFGFRVNNRDFREPQRSSTTILSELKP